MLLESSGTEYATSLSDEAPCGTMTVVTVTIGSP